MDPSLRRTVLTLQTYLFTISSSHKKHKISSIIVESSASVKASSFIHWRKILHKTSKCAKVQLKTKRK